MIGQNPKFNLLKCVIKLTLDAGKQKLSEYFSNTKRLFINILQVIVSALTNGIKTYFYKIKAMEKLDVKKSMKFT
jgi:hypothetical protein